MKEVNVWKTRKKCFRSAKENNCFFLFFFSCFSFSFLSCIYVGRSASILLGNSRVPCAVRAENQSYFHAPTPRPRLYWLSSPPQRSPEEPRTPWSIFAAPSPKGVSLEGDVHSGQLSCWRLGRGMCVYSLRRGSSWASRACASVSGC